jgi:hypothetical protein
MDGAGLELRDVVHRLVVLYQSWGRALAVRRMRLATNGRGFSNIEETESGLVVATREWEFLWEMPPAPVQESFGQNLWKFDVCESPSSSYRSSIAYPYDRASILICRAPRPLRHSSMVERTDRIGHVLGGLLEVVQRPKRL